MNGDKKFEDPLTERVLKACFEIIANLEHGFAEAIYMRVSAIPIGLLINFGRHRLEWRRLSP